MTTVLVTVDRPRVCRKITAEVRAAADECRRDNLLRDHTAAVVAPVFVTGWCWAASDDYRTVLAQCLGVPQVVQIGSAHRTQSKDAHIIYPPVVAAIAQHGTAPQQLLPVLRSLLACLPSRQPWTASLLTAPPTTPQRPVS